MNRLREKRIARRFTQWQLAKSVKKTQPWIWQIEREYLVPSGEDKDKLAIILGCEVKELFPEEKE